MTLAPFAISRTAQGYVLSIHARTISLHRRKRDALSHAVAAIHARAILR